MKTIIFGFLIILFIGCTPHIPIEITLSEVIINTTPNITEPPQEYQGKLAYFISGQSLAVIDNRYSIVVDVGDSEIMNFIENNGIQVLGYVVSETDFNTKTKYFVLSQKPKVIWDNGMPSETRTSYIEQAKYFNLAIESIKQPITRYFGNIIIEFFVPYVDGFEHGDMIPVKVNNLLYMSSCADKACESYVNTTSKYIIPANRGICPTNSLDFVLRTGAKIYLYYGECQAFLDDAKLSSMDELRFYGIEPRKLTGVHIENQ